MRASGIKPKGDRTAIGCRHSAVPSVAGGRADMAMRNQADLFETRYKMMSRKRGRNVNA